MLFIIVMCCLLREHHGDSIIEDVQWSLELECFCAPMPKIVRHLRGSCTLGKSRINKVH